MRSILAGFLVLGLLFFGGMTVSAQQKPQYLESEPLVLHTASGRYEFTVEVADEPKELATGLMFREEMEADHGMLFDFGQSRMVSMWMKNTPLSLDMVFIRPDGIVYRIAERTEPFSEAIISSQGPVSHVLEIKGGVARMIGLKPGDRVEHRTFSSP